MNFILFWVAKIASHPISVTILLPALQNALSSVFQKWADKREDKAAVTAAKAAQTAEELREASRLLSDSSRRSPDGR